MKSALEPGNIISEQFKVVSQIGAGAMGEVYLVENLIGQEKRFFALKILPDSLAEDPVALQRFESEVNEAQKVQHENVVAVHPLGRTNKGHYYFTMAYIDGGSLRDKIGREEQQSRVIYQDLIRLLYSIANGIAALHEKNIIHRDIKPENIFITKDGIIKLGDFGISKNLNSTSNNITLSESSAEIQSDQERSGHLQMQAAISSGRTTRNLTQIGALVGTAEYAAPEAFKGETSTLTDIYSFGILAFELVAGHLPFRVPNGGPNRTIPLAAMHMTTPIPRLSELKVTAPEWIQILIDRCCMKDSAKRFQDIHEIIDFIKINSGSAGLTGWMAKKLHQSRARITVTTFSLVSAFLVGLLSLYLSYAKLGYSQRLSATEVQFQDKLFSMRGKITPPQNVLMVLVNEETYKYVNADIGKNFPRSEMARFINLIAPHSPKGVLLDFLYFDKGSDPKDNQQLAEALQRAPVYIGKYYSELPNAAQQGLDDKVWATPQDIFAQSAKGLVNVLLLLSRGDVVREFNFEFENETLQIPITQVLNQKDLPKELPKPGEFINFYGAPFTVRYELMHRIFQLADSELSKLISDKYLVVGQYLNLATKEKMDSHLSPFKKATLGAEIHATTIGNLIERSWIKRCSFELEAFCLMFLIFLLSFLILKLPLLYGGALFVCSVVGWSIASYIIFTRYSYYIPGYVGFYYILPFVFLISCVRMGFEVFILRRLVKRHPSDHELR